MGVECQILIVPTKAGVYRSGDPVTGTVKFRLDKQTTFETAIIRFEGKGRCSWSESGSNNSTTWYTGNEEYMIAFKSIVTEKNTRMEAGDYDCPFEFFLPQTLPSSFKDPVCTIAYKVMAIFTKPGLFGKKEFDTEIPVYGYLEPCSPEPLIFGLTKNPFSLTSSGAIDVKVEIEKTFLMPGENIKLNFTVINKTDLPVNGFRTKLLTVITYISDDKNKRKITKDIKESVIESAGTRENSENNFSIIVPTLPNLYSIQYCSIMTHEYNINVTARLPFPHRDASVEIPVVIGERSPASTKNVNFEQRDPKITRELGFVDMY